MLCFAMCFACIRPRGVALVQGELACVQGELFVISSFGLVVCALCLSVFSSRMCRVITLPRGSETCLLQVILPFAFPLAFDRLLDFVLVVSFLFLFSLVTKTWVL
jgi:hypothetical protein